MNVGKTLKITANELRNIMEAYEIDPIEDDDRSYAIKTALNRLEVSDKIIYLLYMELETKTAVAEVLGISRISATRIIKRIEGQIKEIIQNDRLATFSDDNNLHN